MNKKPLLIALAAVLVLLIGGFAWYSSMQGPVDAKDTSLQQVKIEEGATTGTIADVLKEEGLIKSASVFKMASRMKGYDGSYQAGIYAFSKSMSMEDIMKDLSEGNTNDHVVTIVEGQSLIKIAAQLEEEGVCTEEEFLKEAETGKFDYEFLKDAPEGAARLEGFLYPNTYAFPADATAHDVIDDMLAAFDVAMHENDIYSKVEKDGRSLYTILTEASIVQREAGLAEDQPKVASVIDNRIAEDMPLQMDSIIAYIHNEDKVIATYEDIAVESEYNPYQNKGLPPTPICSPGMSAILAVLEPADTDYLYFVASDKLDGSNVFSEDYDEFLKNKEAFEKAYKESQDSSE